MWLRGLPPSQTRPQQTTLYIHIGGGIFIAAGSHTDVTKGESRRPQDDSDVGNNVNVILDPTRGGGGTARLETVTWTGDGYRVTRHIFSLIQLDSWLDLGVVKKKK